MPVGPDLKHQAIVVGALADAGLFDFMLNAHNRREAGIDGNIADGSFLAQRIVYRAIAASVFDRHFDDKRHIIRHRSDDMLGVNDLDRFVVLDIGRFHDSLFVAIDADRLGLFADVFDDQAFDIQDDIGHILDHAGYCRDFVLHALNADVRHGGTFQARKQHAPKAIADRHAETAFKRLRGKLAVRIGQRCPIGGDPARQFKATPFDPHKKTSHSECETGNTQMAASIPRGVHHFAFELSSRNFNDQLLANVGNPRIDVAAGRHARHSSFGVLAGNDLEKVGDGFLLALGQKEPNKSQAIRFSLDPNNVVRLDQQAGNIALVAIEYNMAVRHQLPCRGTRRSESQAVNHIVEAPLQNN